MERRRAGVIRRGPGRVEARGIWLYMDIPSPSNLSFPSRLNLDRCLFSQRQGKNPSFNFLERDGMPIRD